MNNGDIVLFGETTFRNERRRFGIKRDDRRRHMYLIGKTGMGKSTIQENMIIADIRAGQGVAVVDPHGDLVEKILRYVPSNRVNDIIYFNPADYEYPIAFNVLEQVDPSMRHLVASGLIGVFRKLWADSWGPRLEYILRNAILAVLDYPGSTLLAVTRMLSDKEFRKKVVDNVSDPVVKAFWTSEFAGYADKFATEAVSPIQNKVGQFLSSSIIRNIVGQVKSTIDLRHVMDDGKILLLNLSKGRIGEDNSAMLGSMIITKIQLAAMSRVDTPEHDRKDFYLYVDEFQNFATDAFADILSEARKYHLNLILAHQYVEQLPEKVASAIFGNVGTLVTFRVGATDAEFLLPEFTPTFTQEDIVNLPKYEMYLRLMIDGAASTPFSARGLPPLTEEEKTGFFEKVILSSRERYAKRRDVVEEKINKWHESLIESGVKNEPAKAKNYEKKSTGPYVNKTNFERPRYSEKTPFQKSASDPSQIKRPTETSVINTTNTVRRNLTEEVKNPAFDERAIIDDENVRKDKVDLESLKKPDVQTSSFTDNTINNQATVGAKTPIRESVSSEKIKHGPYKYEAVCASCGITTMVPFAPDGLRPIYCKDCLSKMKQEKNKQTEERRKAKEVELREMTKKITPEISLGQALSMKPVAFSHRREFDDTNKDDGGAPSSPVPMPLKLPKSAEERDLMEEREIDFTVS